MDLDQDVQELWKAFHKTLDPFPHSFQLEDQDRLTASKCRQILHTLQLDFDTGLDTAVERARALNLMCFLHCLLDQKDAALDNVERALRENGQGKNLVSLANKAVVLWRRDLRCQAEEQVKQLESHSHNDPDFEYLVIRARAEQAYSYNSFGVPHFLSKAIILYSKVVKEGREPDTYLWKFGLALAERRAMYQRFISLQPNTSQDEERLKVLRAYLDILQCCQNDKLLAKVYVEVALLIDNTLGSESARQLEGVAKLSCLEACKKALELNRHDPSVLWKCGKIFRSMNNLNESYTLLKECIEIKPTTTVLAQLGLTCKKLARQAKYQRKAGETGQGRGQGPSRGGSWKGERTRNSTPQECVVLQTAFKGGRQVRFCQDDLYVQEAFEAFEEAALLSQRQNVSAMISLGQMCRDLGRLEDALTVFNRIISSCLISGGNNVDKINAYEHAGLVLLEMSRSEETHDEEKKKRLAEEGEAKLSMALQLCSRLCRRQRDLGPSNPCVSRSFPELLRSAETSNLGNAEKSRMKARLLLLIKGYEESMAVLSCLSSEDQENEETLKIQIKNLVGLGQYDEALKTIGAMRALGDRSDFELFQDEHYFVRVNMQAARDQLRAASITYRPGSDSATTAVTASTAVSSEIKAGFYFSAAFRDATAAMLDQRECEAGSECSEAGSSEEDKDEDDDRWDVMIIHPEDAEGPARDVASALIQACGLKVTVLDDDCTPGMFLLDRIFWVMSRSRQVVVVLSVDADSRLQPGSEPRTTSTASRRDSGKCSFQISPSLGILLERAALRRNTAVLLVGKEEGAQCQKIPRTLVSIRRMQCPPQLLCGNSWANVWSGSDSGANECDSAAVGDVGGAMGGTVGVAVGGAVGGTVGGAIGETVFEIDSSGSGSGGVLESGSNIRGSGGGESYRDRLVQDGVCELFSFLVNVDFEQEL